MTLGLAVAASLASAVCAAVSQVLQHRSARQGPPGRGARVGLVWHLLQRPLWLAGLVAAGVSFALHAVALDGAQLAVVQPILVSALLFALPAAAIIEGRRPSVTEWLWAALLVAGLGAFLVISQPSAGVDLPPAPLISVALVGAGLVGVLSVVAAQTVARAHRAGLLGFATGVAYGMVAPLVKIALAQFASPPDRPYVAITLVALAALGTAAIVLNQAAYQAGPLAATLPPLTIGDPLMATLIGSIAFGDALRSSAVDIVGEVLSAVAVCIAVTQLARRTSAAATSGPAPAPGSAPGSLKGTR